MKSKVFLNVTSASTLDVTASLDYYEEKKNREGKITEEIYKGKIIFSITEKGKDGKAIVQNGRKKYLKSYMDKDTAKVIFQSILNDSFMERFGSSGIKDYGGSDNNQGQLRARITKVYPKIDREKNKISHYVFAVDEGKGKPGKNGRGTKIDGDADLTVESWVTYLDALRMATEILDYIRDEEIKNMLQGKPLYTIMYGREGKKVEEEKQNEQAGTKEQKKREIKEDEYIIDIEGKYNGRKMSELNDKELQFLLNRTENNDNEKAKEIYKHAVKEAKKRMGRAL